MSDVFGIEGGGNQGAAKPGNARQPGEKEPTGEGPAGRYMQYDNEMGAMMLNLPPRFAKYKHELEEDLMDEFYGAEAGGNEMHKSINQWIAEWIRKKEDEDPDLIQPDDPYA